MQEIWVALTRVPIRLIIRDTQDYRDLRSRESYIWLSDAEKHQLLSGDIPYFFRYLGKPEIYYFDSPTGIRKDCFLSSADPASPSKFNLARLKKVFPNVLAQVCDRFYPSSKPKIQGKNFVAARTKDCLKITTTTIALDVKYRT